MQYRSCILIFLVSFCKRAESSERDVLEQIFENYDPRVRPGSDENQPIFVQVQMNIISLLEVNAPQEYIKMAVSFDHFWHDDSLTWDPLKFNGTKKVNVPVAIVWRPDVTVVTAVLETEHIKEKEDLFLKIQYNGDIHLNFPIVLTNSCPMITDSFPFDAQECAIILSSWNYLSDELLLQPTGTVNPIQKNNTEWEVFPYESEITDFISGKDIFSNLIYHQKMKRKSTYYMWVIVVPTFIITALSIAGIFAPFNNIGDREEKVTLGLTTLLTLAVILSLVTGEMPRATKLPLLGRFILFEISICVVSMALSVCTMFLHQRATTRQWGIPLWLTKITFCNRADRVGKLNQAPDSEPNIGSDYTINHEKLDGMYFWQLNRSILKLNNLLVEIEANDNRKVQWIIIFDQFDLIFFIGFQVVHAIYFLCVFSA